MPNLIVFAGYFGIRDGEIRPRRLPELLAFAGLEARTTDPLSGGMKSPDPGPGG